jgi:hypothetical protein
LLCEAEKLGEGGWVRLVPAGEIPAGGNGAGGAGFQRQLDKGYSSPIGEKGTVNVGRILVGQPFWRSRTWAALDECAIRMGKPMDGGASRTVAAQPSQRRLDSGGGGKVLHG